MPDGEMRLRGPILNPRPDGSVSFIADGLLVGDKTGRIISAGPFRADGEAQRVRGILCPAFLDAHTHIPQHPIRGRFMEGIDGVPAQGRLLAALNRNVFPAESKCGDPGYAREVIAEFLRDTRANGVIGGCAYMTIHPQATRLALQMLPVTWNVGLVLMDMNCPPELRTDLSTVEGEIEDLARDFGKRLIVTDRFAVCVSSTLRKLGSRMARKHGLRTQTHLNEQVEEKKLVEETLYPDAGSYTNVYARDGLLDHRAIVAHCIQMRPEEFQFLRRSAASIAHCPTSNELLGSGVMPLDQVKQAGIDYAICTDVGASPTTSMLEEMSRYLRVHQERSTMATPSEALFRSTFAPARIMGMEREIGSFDIGKAMTFIEIECDVAGLERMEADEVIRQRVLGARVGRVTVSGQTIA